LNLVLSAAQLFRTAKSNLLACESRYDKTGDVEAAGAVQAAQLQFEQAKRALREASRV